MLKTDLPGRSSRNWKIAISDAFPVHKKAVYRQIETMTVKLLSICIVGFQ